jgi:hypothetical protein
MKGLGPRCRPLISHSVRQGLVESRARGIRGQAVGPAARDPAGVLGLKDGASRANCDHRQVKPKGVAPRPGPPLPVRVRQVIKGMRL